MRRRAAMEPAASAAGDSANKEASHEAAGKGAAMEPAALAAGDPAQEGRARLKEEPQWSPPH